MKNIRKIINTLTEVISSLPCSLGIHDYDYFIEEHKCVGIKNVDTINMKIRECNRCGKRQHGMLPRAAHLNQEWQDFHYEPDETLYYTML